MNLPEKYPLMTYLQSVVLKFDVTKITSEQLMMNPHLMEVTGRGIKGALILLCTGSDSAGISVPPKIFCIRGSNGKRKGISHWRKTSQGVSGPCVNTGRYRADSRFA